MSDKYTGERCIVCGSLFADGDDIVVCPECGTPCHRTCWEKTDKCSNTALHESGGSWKPAAKVTYTPPDGEPIRCIRCGALNEPDSHFCVECGLPLNFDRDSSRPFNGTDGTPTTDDVPSMQGMQMRTVRLTPQSDMGDGIKLADFIDYIGTSSLGILASFIKFAKTDRRLSFNLGALIFPELYFFYRKMTKLGILFLTISFILSIPNMIYYGQSGAFGGMVLFSTPIDFKSADFLKLNEVCGILDIIMNVLAASYANYWYYKKARQDITRIRSEETASEKDTSLQIRKKGGTSWAAVGAAFVSLMIATLAFMLSLSFVYR